MASKSNVPPANGNDPRRTMSGRFMSNSRDDADQSIEMTAESADFRPYTVHIPPTPDNQPMSEPNTPRDEYGNPVWSKDEDGQNGHGANAEELASPSKAKKRRPLTRKVAIAPGIIYSYR